MKQLLTFMLVLYSTLASLLSMAIETPQEAVSYLQREWAIGNYQLKDNEQKKAFEKLIMDADRYVREFPSAADVLIWRGIIKSTYAGISGGLGALKFAKASKADLEKAIKLNPQALNGSAYTSLGTLYFKVPGWPIGFGDDDKAQQLLEKALTINPGGIDSNYFYADYLLDQKQYQQAKAYLQKALNSPSRPGREIADQGRRKEIREALAEVEKKL